MTLRFHDDCLEQRFCNELRERRNRLWLTMEAVRAAAWLIAASKGSAPAAAALFGGAVPSTLLLLLFSMPGRRRPLRLLYCAVVAVNLLHATVGLGIHASLYPYSTSGSPAAIHLRALLLSMLANGVMWLVFYATFTPLPFRWQLPQTAIVAAMLAWSTPAICSNPNMQHGAVGLHSAMQLALSLLVPAAAMRSAGPAGLSAPSLAAQRLCTVYQPAVLLLGLTTVCTSLYLAERQHRQAFLAQQQPEAAEAAAAAAVAAPRLPSGSPTPENAAHAGADTPVGGSSGSASGTSPMVSPHVAAAAAALVQRAQQGARAGRRRGAGWQHEVAPAHARQEQRASGDPWARCVWLTGIALPAAAFIAAYLASWLAL